MVGGGYRIGSYKLGQTLGVGTFGKVKLAVHEGTDLRVAVKIVNKAKMQTMDMHEKVRREIAILQTLHHPHVIRLYELIDTPTDIFMSMEYVPSGELFDYIVQHSRLQEPEARRFFQQIISGVEYCHNHVVCHRDLKPENILLDANLNVKVGDFGLSNFMRDGDFLKTSCGSPNYASPEVVSGKPYAGPEVDVWSCAVILYALLCGSLPFDDEHVPNLFKKIKHGNFTLPGHLSEQSRSLIVRMLTVDPVKRITLKEIRRHPWFRANLPSNLSTSVLRCSMNAVVDNTIIEEMRAVCYTVDPETLVLYPPLGTFPSKTTVAYQLLADRKSMSRQGKSGFKSLPLTFSRDIQRRVAATSFVVDPDQTPFNWMAENLFTSIHMIGPPMVSPLASIQTTQCTPGTHLAYRAGLCPISPLSRPPNSGGSSIDWSPGSPMWGTSRWKLGIESSLESAIIVTAILNTLKALNYEWRLINPFKMRCRAIRPLQFIKTMDDVGNSEASPDAEEYRSRFRQSPDEGRRRNPSEFNDSDFKGSASPPHDDISADDLNDLQSQNGAHRYRQSTCGVVICIQLFKISAARYLIDVQLFDGPTLTSMSESLWLTSAIYSALTQIQLQESPGSALPAWSPSTPMMLGTGHLMAPNQGLFG